MKAYAGVSAYCFHEMVHPSSPSNENFLCVGKIGSMPCGSPAIFYFWPYRGQKRMTQQGEIAVRQQSAWDPVLACLHQE